MAKRKAKTSAAEKPKPDYMTDPAQIIEQLQILHSWQCRMLELLHKALPAKPQKPPDEPSPDGT